MSTISYPHHIQVAFDKEDAALQALIDKIDTYTKDVIRLQRKDDKSFKQHTRAYNNNHSRKPTN